MARPRIKLDDSLIEELAGIACTIQDIATFCHCSKDTIERHYMEAVTKGRVKTQVSLRRKQFQVAMNDEHKNQGTMLVWLGRALLGQTDKLVLDPLASVPPQLTPEQFNEYVERMIEARRQK